MGNFHGNASEVREYFNDLVKLVQRWEVERRIYSDTRSEDSARRLTMICIELTAWLDEHTWVETLPLVREVRHE